MTTWTVTETPAPLTETPTVVLDPYLAADGSRLCPKCQSWSPAGVAFRPVSPESVWCAAGRGLRGQLEVHSDATACAAVQAAMFGVTDEGPDQWHYSSGPHPDGGPGPVRTERDEVLDLEGKAGRRVIGDHWTPKGLLRFADGAFATLVELRAAAVPGAAEAWPADPQA